jgi:Transposase DNA-binding/Transposase Tn5 dimerisation domain
MKWVEEELAYTNLGDLRLNRRLMTTVANLAAHPMASVPEASGSMAATKGTYRLWDNEAQEVTPQAFLYSHQQRTTERIAALGKATVLAVQDTTEIAIGDVKGAGYLDRPRHNGLKLHSVLAVSENGVPLGLLEQHAWARPSSSKGKAKARRKRATAQKESQRWLDGFAVAQAVLPANVTTVVTVADREADIYDLFAAPRQPNAKLLIRATHNRRVRQTDDELGYLKDILPVLPVGGTLTVEVTRQANRPARHAVLTIRWTELTLLPPRVGAAAANAEGERVQVVWVYEEHAPEGQSPIDWLLLTTLPVDDFAQAAQCVRWYSLRWLVERFHFTLKSGCQVEELQLETADRFMRALATYSIVAWRLLWLTHEARTHPDQPCNELLETVEWQLLVQHFEPQQRTSKPPTLHQAVLWIAQLGGFLGRKADGEPGVKTIWRGLRRLSDMTIGAQLQVERDRPNTLKRVGSCG